MTAGNPRGSWAFPLISSEFVGAIPMISRLLKELGVPLDWVDSHDSSMIEKTMARSAGLFLWKMRPKPRIKRAGKSSPRRTSCHSTA